MARGWRAGHDDGLGVPKPPKRQREYLSRLDEAGIAAIAISRDLYAPTITAGMRQEADRRGFPILDVSIEVPFVAIAHTVAAAAQAEGQQRLLLHLRIFDTLRASTIEGLEVGELFHRLEELVGCRLYLGSRSGGPLIEGVPAPPPELARAHLPRAPGQPPWIPEGYVVSVPQPHRAAASLFVLPRDDPGDEGSGSAWGSAGLATAQHIATIAALELAKRSQQREMLRRHGAETLEELLAGSIDHRSAAKRLSLAGFDPSSPLLLLAIAVSPGYDPGDLAHAWDESTCPHLLVRQRDVYALVPSEGGSLRPLEETDGLRSGVSRPFLIGAGLAMARHEAQWALVRATETDERLVRFPEGDVGATWLPAHPAALSELVDRVLGPLVAYDGTKGTELLGSLRTWLDQDRRAESAAKLLGVHKHTLDYRLRRVEELTGRSLSRMEDVVDFWLALKAEAVIAQ